jgi:fumarate reductase flavoprotein subunit
MKSYKTLFIWGILIVILAAGLIACTSTKGGESSAAAETVTGPSGTATGTAAGFSSEISVTIIMENGKIVDVQIEAPGETPTIGAIAIERAPGIMIRNNSPDIDIISGASITSIGISTAAQAAVDQIAGSN